MHFLTVFWKLLFALVPPTDYCNGWACFVVSISGIGLLTAFIGDLASHFGCTVGLKDSVTAVVFVALGTSVPGTCTISRYISVSSRAHYISATQDQYMSINISLHLCVHQTRLPVSWLPSRTSMRTRPSAT